jgi:hypothetical protein
MCWIFPKKEILSTTKIILPKTRIIFVNMLNTSFYFQWVMYERHISYATSTIPNV